MAEGDLAVVVRHLSSGTNDMVGLLPCDLGVSSHNSLLGYKYLGY